MPLNQITEALINSFEQWGKPDWIKVDNGRPFGDPGMEQITKLALWLISYDIKMIWNRPRIPQDNAKVERSQGILTNWVNPKSCTSYLDLQQKVNEQGHFYNYHFPNRRMNNKTKVELYPNLLKVRNSWNPSDFKFERALRFIARGTWERKVSKNGQIKIFGYRFTVGIKYTYQIVSVHLNPALNQWIVYDEKGNLIKSNPTEFSHDSIFNLL